MLFLKNQHLLPKKQDYQAVLSVLKNKYGRDMRNYKYMAFDPTDFNRRLTTKFPNRYQTINQTETHFYKFWETVLKQLKNGPGFFSNQDYNTVYDAREIIVMCMYYDFQKVSNIEYF